MKIDELLRAWSKYRESVWRTNEKTAKEYIEGLSRNKYRYRSEILDLSYNKATFGGFIDYLSNQLDNENK